MIAIELDRHAVTALEGARLAGLVPPVSSHLAARPLVIGLSGYAGAGKSSVAQILEAHYGFMRTRFADPLKAMLRAIGLGTFDIEGGGKELPHPLLCGKTPRYAMQTLGTEWARKCIDPEFWVALWKRQAASLIDDGMPVVVDDLRFPNELAVIKELGGWHVRVDRFRGGDAMPLKSAIHESETALAEAHPDAWVRNHGTLDALNQRVADLVKLLRSLQEDRIDVV